MPLTTLADNKAYLGIDSGDTTQDALIEIFRKSVEQSVINYCEVDFQSHVATNERLDGLDADVIVPKFFPIISVQAIKFGASDASPLDSENYYFDTTGIILTTMNTPFYRGIVYLDYTYGYASVPDDVKLCVYQSVKAEYQRKSRNAEDISSRSKEGESESYSSAWDPKTGLPKAVISKLQAYRVYECPQIGMAQRNK